LDGFQKAAKHLGRQLEKNEFWFNNNMQQTYMSNDMKKPR